MKSGRSRLSMEFRCPVYRYRYPSTGQSGLVHQHVVKHTVKLSAVALTLAFETSCGSRRGERKHQNALSGVESHAFYLGYFNVCQQYEQEKICTPKRRKEENQPCPPPRPPKMYILPFFYLD
jgi:hypothetical protein